ncbi:hypothetical protein NBRC110019_02750 [Neptunitalea chrysea]|uniref:DUF2271 domain-containing protein n=1 Tax=Neptunitalea chrysea TaxID=1647581 RepID=A0A9W6B2U2_9FLAO|nr:DUF2271 domain-containing protein [Neptunitalea chrysea]GLB51236.1 hypothetical protein NBRC110019_02750 [Neptunitalea chrysea]
MKKVAYRVVAVILIALVSFSFKSTNTYQNKTVKCLLQTKNYAGEGAYIAISLLNDKETYKKTLYMVGDDNEWYESLQDWYRGIGHANSDVDAISGATINPGARSVIVLDVPEDTVDKGYKIRFESAVEDQEYYATDLEVALTSENLNGKFEGTGYIRYVRFISK